MAKNEKIVEYRKLYKLSEKVIIFVTKPMEDWKRNQEVTKTNRVKDKKADYYAQGITSG